MSMDKPKENLDNLRAQWEREQQRTLTHRIIRWAVGIPLILVYPLSLSVGILFPGSLVVSICVMAVGVILISPEILSFLSDSAGSLLWPRTEVTPTPNYDIPEALVAQGKYKEAEAECERIMAEFPDEVKPHVDMLNVAVVWVNDAEMAARIYDRGMKKLRRVADREVLTRMYKGIKSRLKADPSGKPKVVAFHPKAGE